MKKLLKTLLISVAISATTLFAGAGHSHSHDGGHGHSHAPKKVSKERVEKIAKIQRDRLVKHDKIEKSWSDVSISSLDKKKYGHHMEWVAVFTNSSVKDADKQKLYVFISEFGEITGANHSGK